MSEEVKETTRDPKGESNEPEWTPTGVGSVTSRIAVVPKAEVITSASIEIYKVELYKGLKAIVKAFDSDKKLLKAWEVAVDGDEYQNWTDDVELEALLLSKVGLARQ